MEANVNIQIIRNLLVLAFALLVAGCATHLGSGSPGIPAQSGLAKKTAHPATTTITVTSTADSDLGATPGVCPAGKAGELRYAMCTAAAGDTIAFDTKAMCSDALPCTIVLGAPLPPIENDLTIDAGKFGKVAIDGAKRYRAFFVDTGVVTIARLEVRNAAAIGGNGGDHHAQQNGGGGGAGLGAGIFVNQATATVHVVNDYFVDILAKGGDGWGGRSSVCGAAGGGGLGGDGGESQSGCHPGYDTAGSGGGGVLGAGGNASGSSVRGRPGAGGFGGGGGGGCALCTGGSGGAGYGSNPGGRPGNSSLMGGAGGFGGGGGGDADGTNAARQGGEGGDGGFGGGGGGGAICSKGTDCTTNRSGRGGNGGPGGGGGGTRGYPAGRGGSLGAGVAGMDGDVTDGVGGGGAAAGPAIFVAFGTLTTLGSGASNLVAIGGTQHLFPSYPKAGSSDVPVFNYAGTVNGSTATGPVPGALSDHAP